VFRLALSALGWVGPVLLRTCTAGGHTRHDCNIADSIDQKRRAAQSTGRGQTLARCANSSCTLVYLKYPLPFLKSKRPQSVDLLTYSVQFKSHVCMLYSWSKSSPSSFWVPNQLRCCQPLLPPRLKFGHRQGQALAAVPVCLRVLQPRRLRPRDRPLPMLRRLHGGCEC